MDNTEKITEEVERLPIGKEEIFKSYPDSAKVQRGKGKSGKQNH